MPAPPELRNALGDIRVIEVLKEFKAYHTPEAYGHVGVSGEVKVNLQRECKGAYPAPHEGQIAAARRVNVPQCADVIGNQHLFADAYHEALHAGGKLVHAVGAEIKLVGNVLVPHDRARDKLREQGDEGAEADIVFLHM